ncbi:MAG: NHL repeat-containing protein [Nitrospinae bacterium]|nr:NHL repeat-containing protein [Nitrospinota bacterium]
MPLTTVAVGRVYDFSHAVGRNAASGTGFAYAHCMALAKRGILYVTNRGTENNFSMRVNKVKIGAPGEEELLAEFAKWGNGDGRSTWPFGVALDSQENVYVSDDWLNQISIFDKDGEFLGKWGKAGSGDGELNRPAGMIFDKDNSLYVVDSGNNRIQKFTKDGKFLGKFGKAGSGEGEFNQPWGITVDHHGNVYVADWKNHRVQKFTADGKFLAKFGRYGVVPPATFIQEQVTPPSVFEKKVTEAGLLNHPTDVAVDPEGDVYVADWANHRVYVFDPEGDPVASLIGDAQVVAKWGQQSIDANPDMKKARRRVKSLEPEWRFAFPTAVEFDPETYRIIVADSQRGRLQIYLKDRNYLDPQANL